MGMKIHKPLESKTKEGEDSIWDLDEFEISRLRKRSSTDDVENVEPHHLYDGWKDPHQILAKYYGHRIALTGQGDDKPFKFQMSVATKRFDKRIYWDGPVPDYAGILYKGIVSARSYIAGQVVVDAVEEKLGKVFRDREHTMTRVMDTARDLNRPTIAGVRVDTLVTSHKLALGYSFDSREYILTIKRQDSASSESYNSENLDHGATDLVYDLERYFREGKSSR